jgi:Tol biopolymer transport system component
MAAAVPWAGGSQLSPGNAFLPDIAPDGRRIVFSHEADGDGATSSG